jgi:lipopolysaccharide export system protein LptA
MEHFTMKRLSLLTLAGAAALGLAVAQTGTNPPPAAAPTNSPSAPPDEVVIEAATMRAVMTNKVMVAMYRGNVRVNHPRWWTRSETLTCNIPVAGKRPESLILESNVFLFSLDAKNRTNTARGDRAVYAFKIVNGVTNETVVLTGKPAQVDTPDSTIESDQITGDLATGTFDGGPNPRMTIKSSVLGNATNNPVVNPFRVQP